MYDRRSFELSENKSGWGRVQSCNQAEKILHTRNWDTDFSSLPSANLARKAPWAVQF